MNIMTRLVLLIVAAGIIFLAGLLGFWVSDRAIPTHALSAFVIDHDVPQGGELQTHRKVDRERLCHTVIDRAIFDKDRRRYDLGVSVYPNGAGKTGYDDFIGVQKIPDEIAVGPASYQAIVCYRCNPIHWVWPVCEPARTQKFNIIPALPQFGVYEQPRSPDQ